MSYTPPSENKISILNSLPTGTGLTAGGTYTGTSEDVSEYGRVGVSVTTASGNPTDGVLWIEVSHDEVTWTGPSRDFTDTSTAQPHMWNIVEKYFRIRYVNGGTATGLDFSIQTQYSVNAEVQRPRQLNESPLPEHEGINVRSFTPSVFDFSSAGLTASETYTSQTFDTLINGYGVAVSIKSVTDGTHFYDESNDGTNWVELESTSIVGGVEYSEVHTCPSRYFRVRFLNGADVNAGGTANFYHAVSQRATLPNKVQSATRISDKNSFIGVTVLAAPGTTIQGESETVDGYTSISASVSSPDGESLNGTLWFQVSRDGILWNSIPRDVRGSDKSIPFLVAITRKYFKIKFVNGQDSAGNTIATDTTNNFQLQTIYARGRALDLTLPMGGTIQDKDCGILSKTVLTGRLDSGNYKNVTANSAGSINVNTVNGRSKFDEFPVAALTPVIQISFPYNINDDITTSTIQGTGTVTQTNNLAKISTSAGTTATESARLESKDTLTFRAGQGALTRFSALFTKFPTNGATSVQGVGIGDASNGYGFAWVGDVFGISYRTDGVQTDFAQTAWNEDTMDGSSDTNNPSGVLLDTTKGNVYQISYGSGFGCIMFSIESQVTGEMVLVHLLHLANNRTTPSAYNPTFELTAEVFKDGTSDTQDYTVCVSDMSAFTQGVSVVTGPINAFQNIKGSSASAENIFTLKNKTTYQSKTNKVNSILKSISITNDSNAVAVFSIVENTTLGGTTAFTDISANASTIEVDTAGTTLTDGRLLWTGSASKDAGNTIDITALKIVLRPGNDYTFSASGGTTGTLSMSLVWQEDF